VMVSQHLISNSDDFRNAKFWGNLRILSEISKSQKQNRNSNTKIYLENPSVLESPNDGQFEFCYTVCPISVSSQAGSSSVLIPDLWSRALLGFDV